MRILKILFLSILSIIVTLYLAFLFVLPYSIDLDKYTPQLTQIVQEKTGFKVKLNGLKVATSWNLSAGVKVEKTDLKYPTDKKFAQINGLQVRLSLLPLFRKKIILDKVSAQKVLMNLDVDSKGKFEIEKYLQQSKDSSQQLPFGLKFSDNMPDISAKMYRVSFINAGNNYTLKGDDFNISNFVLNRKIKVKSTGNLILNNRKQVSYKVSIFSKMTENPKSGAKAERTNIIKVFENLYKYNVRGNIYADVKVKDDLDDVDIDGKINLDKIRFALSGKTFPESHLHLEFAGNKAKIDSILYSDIDSKAFVSGWFKNGKHKYIDLQVASDKLNIENVLFIAKSLGLKDFQDVSANGLMKANFSIRSDFKTVDSSGYLKIKNANITNKLYKVALNAVNADIDFSQDAVKIRQANANLNGQPILIKGIVDKNAFANISVLANNLQLKGLLLTLGQAKVLRENNVLSGLVDIKASLQGRLDKASPTVDVLVRNVNIKNSQSKSQIKIAKIIAKTHPKSKGKNELGRAEVTDLKVYPNAPANISTPRIRLTFNEKEMNIIPTYLYINGIRTTLAGKVSNLDSFPRLNSLIISVPNKVSIPIQGYAGSSAIIKGQLTVKGDINNPQMSGAFSVPLVRIPSTMTVVKNASLQFDKDITVNCPYVQVADSVIGLSTKIDNDFTKGVIAKNVRLVSSSIDLNTLIPVFQNMSKNSSSGMTVINGKSVIEKFKVGGMVSNNINSNFSVQNNVLYITNMRGFAYTGRIGGSGNYDLRRRRAKLNLQGRGLSANPTMIALTGRNDDINGVLDFDSNVSFVGYSQNEILGSLGGHTNFIISNGKMGMLGKFEHLIYAQNIISNNVFKTTLNLIAKGISVKNTGVYRYMKGKISLSNGWANIVWIKTAGPSMSLYMTGRYNLLYNSASLTILGRISDDVVRILGPIGEFSMDKVISYIPKLGEVTSYIASQFTTNPNYENTSMIPALIPKTEFPTREFKVIIDGDTQKQSSVKSFKWLASPKIAKTKSDVYTPPKKKMPAVPDFVKKLPDLRY